MTDDRQGSQRRQRNMLGDATHPSVRLGAGVIGIGVPGLTAFANLYFGAIILVVEMLLVASVILTYLFGTERYSRRAGCLLCMILKQSPKTYGLIDSNGNAARNCRSNP